MSNAPPDDGMDDDEFEAELEALVTAAVQNDIDPRGSWVCETNGGRDRWELVIYELK